MAPPLAADNFGQKQAITTAIKNICEYYPPNTCLRELLQNADDAGASEIEYVLDTNTYGGENLLHEGLKDFQGPALLARNNSTFRDADFESLSSVGDSIKAKDPATTGKFGQGFNAVYHWTDGPWIYSRQWLLLLDVHEWWSPATGRAGGPRWNVVENYDSVEIQNHLKTFNAFQLDHHIELDQTIIRIPLRTAAQAKQSKLFQTKVEISDIIQALKEFGQEIKEGGLLFLKHIRRITIRINSETLFDAEILETDQNDVNTRRQLPSDFKDLYASMDSTDSKKDKITFHHLSIKYTQGETSEVYRYAVQHLMLKSSGDEAMDAWGRGRKLFPWVAIAAQLPDESMKKPTYGRLFTTLRLPMKTKLPVNIHGLFSIAPDRGRLSFTRDVGDLPTKWNTFMFTCVSKAWHQLLVKRNAVSWREEMFSFWPTVNFDPIELWDKLDSDLIDLAISPGSDSAIWNSCDGRCMKFSTALFAVQDQEAVTYGSALAQFRIPAVYLEQSLFQKLQERAEVLRLNIRLLSSKGVRQLLGSQESPPVSEDHASLVLEFCLLDAIKNEHEGSLRNGVYHEIQGLHPLWPTIDGKRSVPCNANLLLPRDEKEIDFFKKSRASTTLDIYRLRPAVKKLLFRDVQCLTAVMRFRALDDLKIDWPVLYPIKSDSRSRHWMPRISQDDQLLRSVWAWINERIQEGQKINPLQIGDLWLIPMNESRIRQYSSYPESHPILLIEPHEPLFEILGKMVSPDPPIFDTTNLSAKVIRLLKNDRDLRHGINCTPVTDPEKLVDWLVAARTLLSDAPDHDKAILTSHLESLTRSSNLDGETFSALRTQLQRLPLYSKLSCVPPFKNHHYIKCSLDASDHLYEAPANLPPVPDIPTASFFRPQTSSEKTLVKRLRPFETVAKVDLVLRHFLPFMDTVPTNIDNALCSVKKNLADWLAMNSLPYSETWQKSVFCHPVIPLPVRDMQRRYRRLHGMVDPSSDIAKLYDKEEDLFPCPDFFARHKEPLLTYGLLSKPIWSTPLERIRHISRHSANINLDKVETILKLEVMTELLDSEASLAEIRNLKWLPGWSTTDQPVILAPNECRGADEGHLVDSVWGTIRFFVHSAGWRKVLGWDKRIDTSILLKQLDRCLVAKQHQKINAVLREMGPEDTPSLQSRSCILGRSQGQYFPPTKIFLPGSKLNQRSLAPFLDEVDGTFALEHKKLLTALQIQPEPSINDLQRVQSNLPDATLSPSDLALAISVLEIATRLKYDPIKFLVPDTSSRLRKLADIVHGEPLSFGGKSGFNFTHPEVSTDLVRRLGVEDSLERAIRLNIESETDDEEDYTPREKLETNITDTLSRYSVSDTFNEFLANADDAGATSISWILDECNDGSYASSSLLTSELERFQGSALLVHNNGVFEEKDFNGFKNIGQGGKKGDVASTGMFGRGALTMYHFTDSPTLISKDFFLVLDPQQKVLPIAYGRRRERRVGMKIPLAKVSRLAPDQLTPFQGLFGFDREEEEYEGTIFRFPLRDSNTESSLKDKHQTVSLKDVRSHLEDYYATARTALLFLRHINEIKFTIRGCQNPQWTVSAKRLRGGGNDVFQRVEITSRIGSRKQTDTWCVGLQTVTKIPPGIMRSGRGSRKSPECGIAACLIEGQIRKVNTTIGVAQYEQFSGLSQESAIKQKVFCRLPTRYESSLPISFHASFAVTGDRRSITLEASTEHSDWNNWLLESCIPALYLETLNYLAPRIGQGVFDFWPTGRPLATLPEKLSQAFWKRLVGHGRDLDNLLALIMQHMQPSKKDGGSLLTLSQNTVSLTDARFDFLDETSSQILQPLLKQIIPTLVRPSRNLRSVFSAKSLELQLKIVDIECLADSFKKEENCKLLEAYIAQLADEKKQHILIRTLLKTMIPQTRSEDVDFWPMLNGCRIMPRPRWDLSLGMLRWQPTPDVERHLIVTKEEESLFAFAADRMVHAGLFSKPAGTSVDSTGAFHDPINIILQCQKFNVREMEISDVGSLLARADSPTASHRDFQDFFFDAWILKLWEYLNRHFGAVCKPKNSSEPKIEVTVDTLCRNAGICNLRLYRVTSNQSYISPQQFSDMPCVVEPSDEQQRKLLALFPGISTVDPKCTPLLLQKEESDLNCWKSFRRLLRAFEALEKTANITIKHVVDFTLDLESKDLMRNLLIAYLTSGHYHAQNDKAILRKFALWPRLVHSSSPPHAHIAAEDAHFCRYKEMLMPWVRDLTSYVKPEIVEKFSTILPKLDVSILTCQKVWESIRKDIPSNIRSKESRKNHLSFLSFIALHELQEVGRIAPNGELELCAATELYDDSIIIFDAAFREEQASRFLHKDFRGRLICDFLVSHGLRTSQQRMIKPGHFLDCAHAISRRWNPESTSRAFIDDSRTVASYLDYQRPDFHNWSKETWDSLALVPMYQAKDVNPSELRYRAARMQQIAQEQTHRTLKDSSNIKHKRVTWSQTSFLKDEPDAFVYQKLPSGGEPSVNQVFDHLCFLVSIVKDIIQSETVEYLTDVRACYDHLQKHLGHTQLLPGIHEARVWLNLDVIQLELASQSDLEASLTSTRLLCLDSPVDPLPIKVARKFMIPYESLLRGLGCKTIVQPKSTSLPQPSNSTESSLAITMAGMLHLRDQNRLVDVYFEAQGERKAAHKVVLAAVSEYCEKQFAGPWGSLLEHQATIQFADLPFLTLSQMIDFAYMGDFAWPVLKDHRDNAEIEKTLHMLLNLLDGTDRWLLSRLHDMVENFLMSATYVRVDTVEWVKQRAEGARATRLVNYCEEFLKNNEDLVKRVRELE